MKRFIVALVLVLVLVTLSGCSSETAVPVISVAAGGEDIVYLSHKLNWDGQSFEEPDGFADIYAEKDGFKAAFYTRGTEIVVDFGEDLPDEIRVTDDVIQTTGALMYLTRETDKAKHTYEDGVLYIPIGKHGTSGRSCGFMAEGKDYRGYRVYATYGDDTCIYDFIILSES